MTFDPIVPFEPVLSDKIPEGDDWIAQIKWDGVRVLTYFDGSDVRLFNRKRHERTPIFPELIDVAYCSARSAILDGEVIALDASGKPSFREVMRRDGIRRLDRVKVVMQSVPIYYMIFDVIFLDGQWLNGRPLEERLDLLSHIIEPNTRIQIVSSHKDGSALFKAARQQKLEGIVAKKLGSRYRIGEKNDDWLKIKNYQDLIAVIGGVTYRSGIVNAVLLGLYDDAGRLWYIGHAGTGKLAASDWEALTRVVDLLKVGSRPFENQPERTRDPQWIKPELTVKIQYIEWPAGHSVRQPSIQAFVRQDPKSCKMPVDHRLE